ERLEDVLDVLGGDALALVGDRHRQVVARAAPDVGWWFARLAPDRDADVSRPRHRVHAVYDQVRDHLLYQRRIALGDGVLGLAARERELDGLLLGERREQRERSRRDLA